LGSGFKINPDLGIGNWGVTGRNWAGSPWVLPNQIGVPQVGKFGKVGRGWKNFLPLTPRQRNGKRTPGGNPFTNEVWTTCKSGNRILVARGIRGWGEGALKEKGLQEERP